jgi:nitroimidazol reductase NimA-like FMN-containing flavoprotein (pyridoxamine 5'-phosphate oxidase superfamily)
MTMAEADGRLRELSRDECLELLQYHAYVGRIGFLLDGRPMVLPVNYLADADSVTFSTADGSLLSSLSGSEVAFEVDDSRPLEHSGWSVLVRGVARTVVDPDDLETLRRGPLRSWAAPRPARWLRIPIETLSGRRLGA